MTDGVIQLVYSNFRSLVIVSCFLVISFLSHHVFHHNLYPYADENQPAHYLRPPAEDFPDLSADDNAGAQCNRKAIGGKTERYEKNGEESLVQS